MLLSKKKWVIDLRKGTRCVNWGFPRSTLTLTLLNDVARRYRSKACKVTHAQSVLSWLLIEQPHAYDRGPWSRLHTAAIRIEPWLAGEHWWVAFLASVVFSLAPTKLAFEAFAGNYHKIPITTHFPFLLFLSQLGSKMLEHKHTDKAGFLGWSFDVAGEKDERRKRERVTRTEPEEPFIFRYSEDSFAWSGNGCLSECQFVMSLLSRLTQPRDRGRPDSDEVQRKRSRETSNLRHKSKIGKAKVEISIKSAKCGKQLLHSSHSRS